MAEEGSEAKEARLVGLCASEVLCNIVFGLGVVKWFCA